MKIYTDCHTYYSKNNDWLCQTPAIAIGMGESFFTITLYILIWSLTVEFNWE